MSKADHIVTSTHGVEYYAKWDAKTGDMRLVAKVPDSTPLLDQNKAMYNHNDGYSASRELRRVATIPIEVALKWLYEEGWWYQDPEAQNKLIQKLNDPDYLYLRTAPGRISASSGKMV